MRNLKLKMLVLLVTGALVVGCATGTDAEQSSASAEPDRGTATTRPADNLERMLLDRPSAPVISSENAAPPEPEKPDLPAEGIMVIDRPSRLRQGQDGWTVLEFVDREGGFDVERLRVLPCELLERMEELAADQSDALFRVSGEITVFDDHAYLLPRKATLESPPRQQVYEQPATAPATAPAEGDTATAPVERDASPDEIIGKLLRERPGRPVLPTAVDSEPQERFVVDRLIRIVSDENDRWYLARFESDNTLRDAPMRVLPCRALERAREIFSDQYSPPEFHASGEVTRYHGRNYLLPRKLIRKRNLGRF